MSKYNRPRVKPATGRTPIQTTEASQPPLRTYEGAPAFERTTKSELFLLAVSNMGDEDTFYELGGDRDSRYAGLVRSVAVADPQWTLGFLAWLRSEANMRTASMIGALEAARAMVAAGIPGARAIVTAVLQRADEPGEVLAYWTACYGRAIPKPVKRGVADAVRRLYSEYALLKYDTASHRFRFGDVIDLTHPEPAAPWQGDLFRYALDRRHGNDRDLPESLDMIRTNVELRNRVRTERSDLLYDGAYLKRAGMTWEDALSLAGPVGANKAKLWAALAPSMGYMGLLRNLRNFDEAGMDDATAMWVANRLANPEQVTRSRQFPYRFLAAYENAPSLRWGQTLDVALNLSLANVPELTGRTLVLIDTSASMRSGLSGRSTMNPAKVAAVFGVTLAKRCRADLFGFASGVFRHDVPVGASVIREVDKFVARIGEVGHGTEIAGSIRATYAGHDRVFVISDEQTFAPHYTIDPTPVTDTVPAHVPLYGFNLGGYKPAMMDTSRPNRLALGGLTDATFKMVPLVESGRNAAWPWMQ